MQFLCAEVVWNGGETFGDFFPSVGEIAVAGLVFGDSKGGGGAMLWRAHRGLVGVEGFRTFADSFEREALIEGDFAVRCVSSMGGGEQGFGVFKTLQADEKATGSFLEFEARRKLF